jgi:serine/threonine protein kinase
MKCKLHQFFFSCTTGFVHDELVNDLLNECLKMSKFDHPNVLNLMGMCLDGGPAPYIIMPFMENGSLLSYLRKEEDALVLKPDDTMHMLDVVRE